MRHVPNPESHCDEDGAVAVMTAVSLVALILALALVVDLGLVRADARKSQDAADAASTAAASVLAGSSQAGVGRFQAACELAWEYFTASVGDYQPPGASNCATYFAPAVFGNCADRAVSADTPSTDVTSPGPLVMEQTFGDYIIRVQMPVREWDSLMTSQTFDPAFDGNDACERIGVEVRRTRDHLFGGFTGVLTGGAPTDSVARVREDPAAQEFSTLILLAADRCRAVGSGGGSGVVVFNGEDAGDVVPGVITGDPASISCGSGEYAYQTGGGGYICAGVERIGGVGYEVAAQAIDGLGACRAPGVTAITDGTLRSRVEPARRTSGVAGSIAPAVTNAALTTRRPVDHAYNCKDFGPTGYPQVTGNISNRPVWQYPAAGAHEPVISSCARRPMPGGGEPPINRLVQLHVVPTYGASVHSGWQVINNCNDTTPTLTTGDVYVDCRPADGKRLTLQGARRVVVRSFGSAQPGISVSTGDRFRVLPPAGQDAYVVLPEGGLSVNGGVFDLTRTFLYMHNGALSVNSNDALSWTAPEQEGWRIRENEATDQNIGCAVTPDQLPTVACFEDLALWTNSRESQSLAGQSNIQAEGVFFIPNAGRVQPNSGSFGLSGGNTSGAGLDLTDAQLWTWRLTTSGQNPVLMRPMPGRFIATPPPTVSLIR